MHPQRSLILITVDCLRLDRTHDVTGEAADAGVFTPVLSRFASESCVFPCAVVAGAPTYYSFPAILGGRHPLAMGRDVLGMAPGEATLAWCLRDAGYATAAFVAGNAYLSPRFGYEQGFDEFEDFLGGSPAKCGQDETPETESGSGSLVGKLNGALRGVAKTIGLGRVYNDAYFRYGQWQAGKQDVTVDDLRRYPSADAMVNRVGPWLAGRGGAPFFLWLHLMDPHHPYYPPLEALAAIGRPDIDVRRARKLNSVWNRGDLSASQLAAYRDDVTALYDAGVYWADRQIGRLLDMLQQFGLDDDTAVAVTADHGEELLEQGRRYHRPDALPESLIRVPLLVRVPGTGGRRFADVPFSQTDLPATLLEAVGVAPGGMAGSSRWNELLAAQVGDATEPPTVTECVAGSTNPFYSCRRNGSRLLAIHHGRYKLTWNLGGGSEQLFDLAADPGETAPLPPGEVPEVRRRLMQAVLDHVKKSQAERDPVARLRARLRDLRLEGAVAFR